MISMAKCKTVVTPLLTHWSYCSLAEVIDIAVIILLFGARYGYDKQHHSSEITLTHIREPYGASFDGCLKYWFSSYNDDGDDIAYVTLESITAIIKLAAHHSVMSLKLN